MIINKIKDYKSLLGNLLKNETQFQMLAEANIKINTYNDKGRKLQNNKSTSKDETSLPLFVLGRPKLVEIGMRERRQS